MAIEDRLRSCCVAMGAAVVVASAVAADLPRSPMVRIAADRDGGSVYATTRD